MENKLEMPWEIFQAISTILARFIRIRDECGLTMPELHVLAYIKEFGLDYPDGKRGVLRGEVTSLLKEVFDYSPKQVNNCVNKLRSKGCIRDYTFDPKKKKAIYDTDSGQMKALIILNKGYKKLDEFTLKAHQIYLDLTGQLLPAPHGRNTRLVKSIAGWLIMEKKELEA